MAKLIKTGNTISSLPFSPEMRTRSDDNTSARQSSFNQN